MARLNSRLELFTRAAYAVLRSQRRRHSTPARILIAHHLLLGDTIMLTPLIAKLREQYPQAQLAMTVAEVIAPLYAARPFGVEVLPFDLRSPASLKPLYRAGPFDLALVPGDNRYSWLALAMRSRWIVAFDGDRPAYKSWPVDELISYPDAPAAWGDMVAGLVEGPAPRPFNPNDWPAPPHEPFDLPPQPYAVLHVGAGSRLKRWQPERWRALAQSLDDIGITPVWSAGRTELGEIVEADPQSRYARFAGNLDLAQLWHLLKTARLLVCPDTGIAHLGRITGTPTVALFGPGSSIVSGAGEYWRNSPFRAVTIEPFACRDQRVLFKREIEWVRRCGRGTHECASPKCMQAIGLEPVQQAIAELIRASSNRCAETE